MTAQEDNFEIDIYGDGEDDYQGEEQQMDATTENQNQVQESTTSEQEAMKQEPENTTQTDKPEPATEEPSKPQNQSLKRKDGADDRPVDHGATSALTASELHWWINDDDIRGWANQSGCEDELQEITFSEHKVNGKSKGQVYLLFGSPQAATAVKHKIESLSEGQKYKQKFTVSFSNSSVNPYKTLPKDANARAGQQNRSTSGGSVTNSFASNNTSQGGFTGGFRGGRGGYNNNRGGGAGGFNRGGFQQPLPGGFQGGGYQNPAMGMQNYNNFGGRGGMMQNNMRGGANMRGRGGMAMGGWGNMAMPNMPAMPMMGGMQGFQNMGFYPQQGAVGDANWNPHGGKRQRQE